MCSPIVIHSGRLQVNSFADAVFVEEVQLAEESTEEGVLISLSSAIKMDL